MATEDNLGTKQQQIDAFMDMLHTQEELHPDLAPYLVEDDPNELFGTYIKHPLVFSIPHMPTLNASVNGLYKQKLKRMEESLREGAWNTVIYLHERPYRLWAFRAHMASMNDAQYWELLGDIWVDSENIWQNEAAWLDCFHSTRPGSQGMMDDDERALLDTMPPKLTIYRGFTHPERVDGLSWTLNRERAEWFAHRLAREGNPRYLATAVVKTADVLAHFTGRGEEEIVVLPEHRLETTTEEIK
jgi:hypothetical protein